MKSTIIVGIFKYDLPPDNINFILLIYFILTIDTMYLKRSIDRVAEKLTRSDVSWEVRLLVRMNTISGYKNNGDNINILKTHDRTDCNSYNFYEMSIYNTFYNTLFARKRQIIFLQFIYVFYPPPLSISLSLSLFCLSQYIIIVSRIRPDVYECAFHPFDYIHPFASVRREFTATHCHTFLPVRITYLIVLWRRVPRSQGITQYMFLTICPSEMTLYRFSSFTATRSSTAKDRIYTLP